MRCLMNDKSVKKKVSKKVDNVEYEVNMTTATMTIRSQPKPELDSYETDTLP